MAGIEKEDPLIFSERHPWEAFGSNNSSPSIISGDTSFQGKGDWMKQSIPTLEEQLSKVRETEEYLQEQYGSRGQRWTIFDPIGKLIKNDADIPVPRLVHPPIDKAS